MDYQQSWRNQKRRKNFKKPHGSYSFKTKKTGKNSLFRFLFNKKTIKPLSFFIFILMFLGIITFIWLSRGLPNPNQLMERQVAQSTKIYDRTGENVLYDIHGDEQRTLINIDNIPNYVKWATIAIEDKNFYEHKGFSFWAIFRTVITNVLRGQKAGGSTLTQQFVKNAILTSEKTYTRKIKELILAYKIEKKFSKNEILQMYLNEIPYGSTAYGIEAASWRYFGKSVNDINLAEAAVLAALPQAPTYYSPYGSHKDALIKRQLYILDIMEKQGYITGNEADKAKNYELKFVPPLTNIIAPHFVMYIKEILTEKYGQKMVEQGGLKIYTTLDLYKQKIAEEVINEWGEKNARDWMAANAALISLDPKTGQILAMVGSRDYFNEEIDGQVNICTSLRQPGSSLKPLVYSTLFTRGYTPNTILYDVVTNFSNAKPYEPKNYDLKERGPVTVRQALAGSLNVPAVKAIYLAGVDNVAELAGKLNYTTLADKDRYGLSLVLGGAEVKLLEHANAYGAFAREGEIQKPTAILKIKDKDGKILEEWKEEKEEKRVLAAEIARSINDILSDNEARSFIFGERNWLTLGTRPVAAKTGTTNDYRDAWTIGYTPSIVTGVWVGNNDNTEMKRGADGGVVAAPIWHDYMQKILGDTPIEYFKKPEIKKTGKQILDGEINVEKTVKIDKATGLLATEHTPPNYVEELIFKENHSILYYVDKNNPLGPAPKNPEKDPQFKLWEDRILAWAEKEKTKATSSVNFSTSTPPTEYDNVHLPGNKPEIKIIKPTENKIITDGLLSSKIKASAPRGITKIKYYINGNLLIEKKGYFFNLENEKIDFLNNGYHNLTVEACDDVDNCADKSIEFNLILEENDNYKDFNVNWLKPANGLALTNVDFPVNVKLEVENPEQIAKIEIFSQEDDIVLLIGTIQPVDNLSVNFSWEKIPISGIHQIFARAYGWSGQTKETKNVALNINNINEN